MSHLNEITDSTATCPGCGAQARLRCTRVVECEEDASTALVYEDHSVSCAQCGLEELHD